MEKQISIRRPEASEYELLAHIWFEAWHAAGLTHPNDLSRDDLVHLFSRNAESVWDLHAAVSDAELVGFAALILNEKKLDQLFVAPKHQQSGVGRLLLDHAKKLLPSGMWLRTGDNNQNAIAFYKRHGFVFDRLEPRPEYDRHDMYLTWQST